MVVATTLIAGLPPISSPYPNPAPNVVDSSPFTGETGQNALSVSIRANYQSGRSRYTRRPNHGYKETQNIKF